MAWRRLIALPWSLSLEVQITLGGWVEALRLTSLIFINHLVFGPSNGLVSLRKWVCLDIVAPSIKTSANNAALRTTLEHSIIMLSLCRHSLVLSTRVSNAHVELFTMGIFGSLSMVLAARQLVLCSLREVVILLRLAAHILVTSSLIHLLVISVYA